MNRSSPRTPNEPAYKSEYALKKLLKSELDYSFNTEKMKFNLSRRKDFSASSCFNIIDDLGCGYLSPQNLERFLQRYNIMESGYINAIMRRLDRDGDGRISYTEFIQIITPASKVYGTEENFTSVFSPIPSSQQTPLKTSTKNKPSDKKNKNRKTSTGKYAEFLMQQIMLEKELEEKRKMLALRLDFSIGKLFGLIDIEEQGYLSIKDFDESLRKMGIMPELNQCHLLFRQYDRDNDNYLTFDDFFDIFNPRSREYSDLLLSRVISNDKKEEFSLETFDMIVDTFILILNIQSITEELKQKLFTKRFNINKVFEKTDMNQLGFLTKGCFRNLLRRFKYYATERDLEGIFMTYDVNKDGKITYAKFIQGICSKSINNV